MPRGSRPGERRGGRQKGTRNIKTLESEQASEAAAKKLHEIIPEAFKGDGHTLLMAIYKDPEYPADVRIDAAKAALPYEKPRLAAIHATVDPDVRMSSVEQDANDVLQRLEKYIEAASAKGNSEPS